MNLEDRYNYVNNRLDEIERLLTSLMDERKVLEAERRTLPKPAKEAGEYVLTAELAPLVKLWVDEYNSDSPAGIGGVTALADRSGIDQRNIYTVIKGLTSYTRLDRADQLLSAMEASWKLRQLTVVRGQPAEIPVIPVAPPSQYFEE